MRNRSISVALFPKGSTRLTKWYDWYCLTISLECGSQAWQWNLLRSHTRQISSIKQWHDTGGKILNVKYFNDDIQEFYI